jgi:hypothetical protein
LEDANTTPLSSNKKGISAVSIEYEWVRVQPQQDSNQGIVVEYDGMHQGRKVKGFFDAIHIQKFAMKVQVIYVCMNVCMYERLMNKYGKSAELESVCMHHSCIIWKI